MVVLQPWWQQAGDVDCGVFALMTFLYLVKRSNYINAIRDAFPYALVHNILEYENPWTDSSPDYWKGQTSQFVEEGRRHVYELFNAFWVKEKFDDWKYSPGELEWLGYLEASALP